ncbi:MAG: hypothetical protein CL846_08380 [Crocinitomicaceae bacterium]|nr:hypothetical protein [Crocinitomicaceae bacterium]
MKCLFQLIVFTFITSSCSPKVTTKSGWTDESGWFETFPSKEYIPDKKYGFRYVEGGTFTTKMSKEIKLSSNQNNVLYNTESNIRRITVASFSLCDHEVTNKEYRKFVTWVKNNQSQDFIYHGEKDYYGENKLTVPICILPDTSVWLKSNFYNPQDTIHKFYFNHPYFDNYPVVGVSKNQAKAYCIWLTQRINEEQQEKFISHDKRPKTVERERDGNRKIIIDGIFIPPLRLPTEVEYLYALNLVAGLDNKMKDFEFKQFSLKNKKGKHTANFGEVKDNNNILLKGFTENIGQDKYTTPVKSFDSEEVVVRYINGKAIRHDYKIYDLHGNVEEWVLDNFIKDTVYKWSKFRGNVYDSNGMKDMIDTADYEERKYVSPYLMDFFTENIEENGLWRWKNIPYEQIIPYKLTVNDDEEIAAKKYIYLRDSLRIYDYDWDENIEIKASRDLHNLKALDKFKTAHLTIGGSWADNQAILLKHMVKVYEKNESSATVGFRVAYDRFSPTRKYIKR